jgi:hypothetical protein
VNDACCMHGYMYRRAILLLWYIYLSVVVYLYILFDFVLITQPYWPQPVVASWVAAQRCERTQQFVFFS